MPYGEEFLEIEFDFVSHKLRFRLSTGASLSTPLRPQSVAEFYAEYQRSLAAIGVTVKINPVPVELKNPIPFAEDHVHADYDADAAHRFWRVLMHAERVFLRFSSGFVGKVSPVHFFWGSFDLAVTRFSGRRAPARAGADSITREAYSHEVISAGFWPGNGGFGEAGFYCYAAPPPSGTGGGGDPSAAGHAITAASASLSTSTTICARLPRPTTRCCSSSKAPTAPPPIWRSGTASHSSEPAAKQVTGAIFAGSVRAQGQQFYRCSLVVCRSKQSDLYRGRLRDAPNPSRAVVAVISLQLFTVSAV